MYLNRRVTGAGERFRVMYRTGGRSSSPQLAGTFKTKREAELRADVVRAELAAMNEPQIPRRQCITTYEGKRVGRVYRMSYFDADGKQVQVTLGREKDGFDATAAQEAAARFLLNRRANPMNPLLLLADSLIKKQEKRYGEALPHLYVARSELDRLSNLAAAELAADPHVFDREPSA